jgi:hypothetical protein
MIYAWNSSIVSNFESIMQHTQQSKKIIVVQLNVDCKFINKTNVIRMQYFNKKV